MPQREMRYEYWIKPNEIALKRQFASAGMRPAPPCCCTEQWGESINGKSAERQRTGSTGMSCRDRPSGATHRSHEVAVVSVIDYARRAKQREVNFLSPPVRVLSDSAVQAPAQVALQEAPPDSAAEVPVSVGPQEARSSAHPEGAASSIRNAA